MKILLTNDDGIHSEGIESLKNYLENDHEVWTVAPDVERSGTSHAITLRDAVRMSRIDDRSYSCGGTPADCVLYSLIGAVDVDPDIVVSGVNHGPNIGTDIIYSGTVAAARQAALMKKPAIAVSVAGTKPPYNFDLASEFVSRNLELMLDLWLPDHFLNINTPNTFDITPDIEVTHPARRIYRDHLVDFTAPSGERYFFLQGTLNEAVIEEGSDWDAVKNDRISVSPVYLHPLNHSEDKAYRSARFKSVARDTIM